MLLVIVNVEWLYGAVVYCKVSVRKVPINDPERRRRVRLKKKRKRKNLLRAQIHLATIPATPVEQKPKKKR